MEEGHIVSCSCLCVSFQLALQLQNVEQSLKGCLHLPDCLNQRVLHQIRSLEMAATVTWPRIAQRYACSDAGE